MSSENAVDAAKVEAEQIKSVMYKPYFSEMHSIN